MNPEVEEIRAAWQAWHKHQYLVHARAAAYHAREHEQLLGEDD